jgi:hypothetical protein
MHEQQCWVTVLLAPAAEVSNEQAMWFWAEHSGRAGIGGGVWWLWGIGQQQRGREGLDEMGQCG